MQKVITDDLEALLDILPHHVRQPLAERDDQHQLLEIVLDLGRPPEARFPDQELILNPKEVDEEDIAFVVARIGNFGDDNRAGIARTLHRISAILNRAGRVVGLTCRVGRAVYGTIKIINDLVESGKSILLLGGPGVGKTTMLREAARVLADDFSKRVIVVDTSNEIAGDGDIPHPGIGHARRMQVATTARQHAVMIEAVENHMPEVIVIDEIGTELEALAARTIAERGVQLIGTAHGTTLENLMMNPTLADLIGGIQSVTIGDEEAKRRGTQKSILERTRPPTFDIVVEIQGWDRVAIHPDVSEAVDSILRGDPQDTEVRWLDEQGEVQMEKQPHAERSNHHTVAAKPQAKKGAQVKLYLFGVNRGRFEQVAAEINHPVEIARNLADANLFITSKSYFRRKLQKVREAEAANLPIYVLRSNTPNQIRRLMADLYPNEKPPTPAATRTNSIQTALAEAEEAVTHVKDGEESIELSPQSRYIRRLQHLIAERNSLLSQSTGKDPNRRVRIYR